MSWFLGIVLDWTPWWLWAIAGGVLLASTFSIWRPILALLPWPAIVALAASIVGALAYLAGRNKGAAGALQRAEQKERALADDIKERGTAARQRADRDAVSGRLRENDGWKRDNR